MSESGKTRKSTWSWISIMLTSPICVAVVGISALVAGKIATHDFDQKFTHSGKSVDFYGKEATVIETNENRVVLRYEDSNGVIQTIKAYRWEVPELEEK